MTGSSFDRRFHRWMQDPEFEAAYKQHRSRIDAIDGLMRALDEAREQQGMTKATLARRIQAEPAAVRRIFSQATPNPQIARVVDMAHELGLEIVIQPMRRNASAASRSTSRRRPNSLAQRSMLRGDRARNSSPSSRTHR